MSPLGDIQFINYTSGMKNETKKAKLQKGLQAVQARSQQNSQQKLTQVSSTGGLPALTCEKRKLDIPGMAAPQGTAKKLTKTGTRKSVKLGRKAEQTAKHLACKALMQFMSK